MAHPGNSRGAADSGERSQLHLIEFEVPQEHTGKAGPLTIGYIMDFLRRREAWDQLPSKSVRPGLALGIPLFSLGVGIMVAVETGYWRWNLELWA